MRKPIYAMKPQDAVQIFKDAETIHVAGSNDEGQPLLRALHGVVTAEGTLAFHSGRIGEKVALIDREVVVSAHEVIAQIPSYFTDPNRACPATTLYFSAQAKGTLRAVEDVTRKADILQNLMERFQPEGRHTPLEAEHPLYKKAIKALLVYEVSLDRISGKAKMAQNKKAKHRQRIMEGLWTRGLPRDLRAIDAIGTTNPDTIWPTAWNLPEGLRPTVHVNDELCAQAVSALRDTYWRAGQSEQEIMKTLQTSNARVGLVDSQGQLVAFARAVSDGPGRAWIYDVLVQENHRGQGLGTTIMRLLLTHPAVRQARSIMLGTRDAQPFYKRLGFQEVVTLNRDGKPSTWMQKTQGP